MRSRASATGAGHFSVADFDAAKAKGGTWYWWWVDKGVWQQSPADKFVIVVHGGAGTILQTKMTPEKKRPIKKDYNKRSKRVMQNGKQERLPSMQWRPLFACWKTIRCSMPAKALCLHMMEKMSWTLRS